MSSYIQNFKKFQPLLAELVARDIKIKYRRSVLGVLWTLLNPLFMMIILSVVFSSIFKFDIENFPLYILSGQLIFNFFNDATTSSMTSIIGSAALIKKVYVPKYLFVIARVFSSFINLMGIAGCIDSGYGSNACRIALDSSPERDSAGDDYFIFTGSGNAPGSSDCQIQRYHAPVFRVYNRAFVFDTGYLSDVNLAGSSPYRGQYQSVDQYGADVPECDVLQYAADLFINRSGNGRSSSCSCVGNVCIFIKIRMNLY